MAVKKKTEPAKIGAPTKYDPSFCERVVELGKQGKSIAQIASSLNVAKRSLYTWMEEHEEFLHAIQDAKDFAEAWFEDQMQLGLWSKEFNGVTWGKAVAARFRSTYGDRTAIEHSGQIDSKVSILDFSQAQ